jgi:hypothetical protein
LPATGRRFGAAKFDLPVASLSIFQFGRIFTIEKCLMWTVQNPELDIREWLDVLDAQIAI